MRATVVQFGRFIVTGGTAALVNLVSRYFLDWFMSFEIAVVLAYLIGMVTAYVLARAFVFTDRRNSTGAEFIRFAVVNAFALALVWCVSVGLLRIAFPATGFDWHSETVAHVIGLSMTAITSYFGHKFYTFSEGKMTQMEE